MRKPAHQPRTETFSCSHYTQTQRTKVCCNRQNRFSQDSVFMFFLLNVSACICLDFVRVRVWPLHQRVYIEVWVCSAGHLLLNVFSCKPIGEGNKGPDSIFEGHKFLFSVPFDSVQTCSQQCWGSNSSAQHIRAGKNKTSSSWTILWGHMVPLLSYRLKSGQLEIQGVSRISDALHELIFWE